MRFFNGGKDRWIYHIVRWVSYRCSSNNTCWILCWGCSDGRKASGHSLAEGHRWVPRRLCEVIVEGGYQMVGVRTGPCIINSDGVDMQNIVRVKGGDCHHKAVSRYGRPCGSTSAEYRRPCRFRLVSGEYSKACGPTLALVEYCKTCGPTLVLVEYSKTYGPSLMSAEYNKPVLALEEYGKLCGLTLTITAYDGPTLALARYEGP